jgi:hypothetical protein
MPTTQPPAAGASDAELQSLLDALCQQTLSEPDAARLAQRLRTDPASRQQYVQYLHMHACLRTHLAQPVEVNDTLVTLDEQLLAGNLADDSAPLPVRAAAPAPVSQANTWLDLTPLILSTGLLLVLGVLLFRGGWSAPSATPEDPSAAIAPAAQPLATLTQLAGTWRPGDTPAQGAPLITGQRLELATGTAEITFADGSTLRLAAPSTLAIVAPSRALLQQGSMWARVGPAAESLVIDTPRAQIRDLGTSFGLNVATDGASEIHVFSGRVQLTAAGDAGVPLSAPLELAAGQARRLAFDSPQWQTVAYQPAQFPAPPSELVQSAPAIALPASDGPTTPLGWQEMFPRSTFDPQRWVTDPHLVASLPKLDAGQARFNRDSILLTAPTYRPEPESTVTLRGRVRLLHPSALVAIGTRLQWKSQATSGETSGVACLLALRSTEDPADPRPYAGILDSLSKEAHTQQEFPLAVNDQIDFVIADNGAQVTFELTNLSHPDRPLALSLAAPLPGRDHRIGVFGSELLTSSGDPLFALEQLSLELHDPANPAK